MRTKVHRWHAPARLLPFVAALACLTAATPAHAALSGAGSEPGDAIDNTGMITKVIRVDGVRVEVKVTAENVSYLDVSSTRQYPTSVSVSLSSADGRTPLPFITPAQVTLERAQPPLRTVRLGMVPVETFMFDPLRSQYFGLSQPNFIRSARLKVTVRLQVEGGTRILRMGELRVRPILPPFVNNPIVETPQ